MIKFTDFIKSFAEGKDLNRIKIKLNISDKKYPNSKIKEKKLNLNKIKIKNTKVEAYEYSFDENRTKLYAISYFILIKGDLLIANFYSISEKETEKMLEYFYNIEKVK